MGWIMSAMAEVRFGLDSIVRSGGLRTFSGGLREVSGGLRTFSGGLREGFGFVSGLFGIWLLTLCTILDLKNLQKRCEGY